MSALSRTKCRCAAERNDYDWLGHGFYFWEGNYTRALEWAKRQAKNPRKGGPKITRPFAFAAVIDLGHCLNLLEQAPLALVKQSHQSLVAELTRVGLPVPAFRTHIMGHELPRFVRGRDALAVCPR